MLSKAIALTLLLTWAGSSYAIQPVDPLEAYDYKDLNLLRTIPQKIGAAACFVTNDGKAIWAYRGGYVGKEFGRIVEISTEGVVITRQVELDDGHWKEEPLSIPLRKVPQGETHALCSHPPYEVMGAEQQARVLKGLEHVKPGASYQDVLILLGKPTLRESVYDKNRRHKYTVLEYYFSRAGPAGSSKHDRFVHLYFKAFKEAIELYKIEKRLE